LERCTNEPSGDVTRVVVDVVFVVDDGVERIVVKLRHL
jgi:hypothetical protein